MARVLVVEDDPDNRAVLESWLRWMGHEVLSAASAVEGWNLIAPTEDDPGPKVDVAVLDIVMPEVSGLQVLNHMRHQPVYARMPAIFLSASDVAADRAAARSMAAQFITKPVTRSVLQAAIDAAFY